MESIDITVAVAQDQISPKLKQLADRINESLKEYGIHALKHVKKEEVLKISFDSEGEVYKGRIYPNETGIKASITYKDEANPQALMLLQRLIRQTLEAP